MDSPLPQQPMGPQIQGLSQQHAPFGSPQAAQVVRKGVARKAVAPPPALQSNTYDVSIAPSALPSSLHQPQQAQSSSNLQPVYKQPQATQPQVHKPQPVHGQQHGPAMLAGAATIPIHQRLGQQRTPVPMQNGQQPSPTPQFQHVRSYSSAPSSSTGPIRHGSVSSSVGVPTPSPTISTPGTPASQTRQQAGASPSVPEQPLPNNSARHSIAIPDGSNLQQLCHHCKKAIPPNVSIYTCLICSTVQRYTAFCVWCFTAGAAGTSHAHDKSYYVTDTDLHIQLPNSAVPAHLWTIRKNVSGRVWYTHKSTGLKTHMRPVPPAILQGASGLPAGWEVRKTPDGRTFYFNSHMGTSSWTKPSNSLPSGWKELRTPDLVPFYVNESLGLSSWERPGEQPKPQTGYGKKNYGRRPDTMDSSSQALLSATKTAAKLTGHGVRIAGRKMGELGKMRNWQKVGRMMNQANNLTGGNSSYDDGDDQYDNDNGDDGESYGDQGESYPGQSQQEYSYQQPGYGEQQQAFQDPFQPEQQPVYDQQLYQQPTYEYSPAQQPFSPDQQAYSPQSVPQDSYTMQAQTIEQPIMPDQSSVSTTQQQCGVPQEFFVYEAEAVPPISDVTVESQQSFTMEGSPQSGIQEPYQQSTMPAFEANEQAIAITSDTTVMQTDSIIVKDSSDALAENGQYSDNSQVFQQTDDSLPIAGNQNDAVQVNTQTSFTVDNTSMQPLVPPEQTVVAESTVTVTWQSQSDPDIVPPPLFNSHQVCTTTIQSESGFTTVTESSSAGVPGALFYGPASSEVLATSSAQDTPGLAQSAPTGGSVPSSQEQEKWNSYALALI